MGKSISYYLNKKNIGVIAKILNQLKTEILKMQIGFNVKRFNPPFGPKSYY